MYLLLDIDMAALNCRQAGRSDKGNHLESGEIRGNMLTRWFAFVPHYIGRMAKNFRPVLGFLQKRKRFRSLSNRVSFPRG